MSVSDFERAYSMFKPRKAIAIATQDGAVRVRLMTDGSEPPSWYPSLELETPVGDAGVLLQVNSEEHVFVPDNLPLAKTPNIYELRRRMDAVITDDIPNAVGPAVEDKVVTLLPDAVAAQLGDTLGPTVTAEVTAQVPTAVASEVAATVPVAVDGAIDANPTVSGLVTDVAAVDTRVVAVEAATDVLAALRFDPAHPNYGAVSGTGLTTAQRNANSEAINLAAQDARDTGGTLVIKGTYECGTRVNIDCHTDGASGRLEFFAPDIYPAVRVGTAVPGATRHWLNIVLPEVIQRAAKANGTWGLGIGVEIANTNTCRITNTHIQNFGTNLMLTAYGNGNAYNEYYLGHLDNGQVNLDIAPTAGSWVNENNFYGGRFSHNSNEGVNVAGTRQIRIRETGNPINNNVFYKPSVEANTAEYHIDLQGSDNTFVQVRWEAANPKLLLRGVNTVNNLFLRGYDSHKVAITTVEGALARYNEFSNRNWTKKFGSSPEGVFIASNYFGAASGAFTVLASGAGFSTDPATEYAASISQNASRFKRTTDAQPRIVLDHVNSRIYLNNGLATPDMYLETAGTGATQFFRANKRLLATGGLGSGGVVSAAPVGSPTKKVPFYDENGVLVGYLGLYDS